MILLKLFIISLLMLLLLSVPIEDEVQWPIPDYTKHKFYSGYLNVTDGKFHYVFFDSQHDPDNDPIVLWLNGGPGCSSLIGMVYQNGPFVFEHGKTSFKVNQYSWNLKANVLYIESPHGVGFSTGTPKSLDDGSVAKYNLQALQSFYNKFPSLRKNDLYISGESYAGIYVPYLSNQILNHNKHPSSKATQIKLKGIMIGNACTDPSQCYGIGESMSMHQYEFLYKHTFISDRDYTDLVGSCTLGYDSQHCAKIRENVDKKFMTYKTSIMNIYAFCYENNNTIGARKKMRQSGKYTNLGIDEGACDDGVAIHHFFNELQVWKHFHVDPIHFSDCSQKVGNDYVMFSNASLWIYPILIQAGLRVWIYSGDVDADVPITGTLKWIDRLREDHGMPVIQPWREWWVKGVHKHEDQVGGMVWKLKGLTFVSVRGSGHEVPRDKPKSAYVMFDSFINGVSPPEKDND